MVCLVGDHTGDQPSLVPGTVLVVQFPPVCLVAKADCSTLPSLVLSTLFHVVGKRGNEPFSLLFMFYFCLNFGFDHVLDSSWLCGDTYLSNLGENRAESRGMQDFGNFSTGDRVDGG